MKLVLIEDVKHVGLIGDVVNVANGYARNYLIPLRYAVPAVGGNTTAVLKHIEDKKKKLGRIRESLDALKEQLEGVTLEFKRTVGSNDRLFGSVTHADIAEALKEKGFVVDKRKIREKAPLKTAGEHQVEVRLHAEVIADVNLVISKAE